MYAYARQSGNHAGIDSYEDVTTEVLDYFIRRKAECVQLGIKDLIIDPGFGFAKTIWQNFLLLKHLKTSGYTRSAADGWLIEKGNDL